MSYRRKAWVFAGVVCFVGAVYAQSPFSGLRTAPVQGGMQNPLGGEPAVVIGSTEGHLVVCFRAPRSGGGKVWNAVCAPVVPQWAMCQETMTQLACNSRLALGGVN